MLRGYDHLQGIPGNTELNRSLANVLAISIKVARLFGFEPGSFSLRILDFAKAEMSSEINRWTEAEQFERIHRPDDADIQLAVVELRVGSDPHPSAVGLRVGEGG